MTATRKVKLRLATGLVLALFYGPAGASDPPAFQAPEDPPPQDTVAAAPTAEPAGPLALQDALALALMNSPELAMFSWEVRSREARALQARKFPNPELDVRVWDMENNPINDRARVILSQTIPIGGDVRRRHDLAATELEIAQWDYEAQRIEVATSVAESFVAVLGAQRRVETAKQHFAFFERLHEQVSQLVESGAMRRLSVQQVTRQVGQARIELQRAQSELSVARFRLAATWGARAPRFTEAVGDLERSVVLPEIEVVLDKAGQSPAVARWDAELGRGNAALRLARARRMPDVTYGVGTRWEDTFHRRDYLVDFEISLPIFDRKQGKIREARFDMARARSGRMAAETASSQHIAELYYVLAESESRRKTLSEEILPATHEMFDAHRVGFDNKSSNLGDLFEARRDLMRSEMQHTEALVDYHQALTALEHAVGQPIN